jgi:hypothetical protein
MTGICRPRRRLKMVGSLSCRRRSCLHLMQNGRQSRRPIATLSLSSMVPSVLQLFPDEYVIWYSRLRTSRSEERISIATIRWRPFQSLAGPSPWESRRFIWLGHLSNACCCYGGSWCSKSFVFILGYFGRGSTCRALTSCPAHALKGLAPRVKKRANFIVVRR